MAIVKHNSFTAGLRGMIGDDMVFRTYRGKTVVSVKPRTPDKALESEKQRANRQRFKAATVFAKAAMLDGARKNYYQKKAKQLKLPNAYTAAITDYMRRAVIQAVDAKRYTGKPGDTLRIQAFRKGFNLPAVEVTIVNGGGAVIERGTAIHVHTGWWAYKTTTRTDLSMGAVVVVKGVDVADQATVKQWPV